MDYIQKDDITIQQIRIFVQAARTGSFSQAAQALYLTQPAVSKWIGKLEKELECRLFVRKGNGVALTEEGEILLTHWGPLLQDYDSAVTELLERNTSRGGIRVGLLTPLRYDTMVMEILRRFGQRCPEVELTLEAYEFKELRGRLLNRELDAALTYSFDLEGDGLQMLPIRKAALYLMGTREALEDKTAEGYRTLLLISRSESRRGGELAMEGCREMGFQFEKIRYYPNLATMELAARQGKGVMMCGKYMLQRNDSLLRFPVPKEYVSNDLVLVWPEGEAHPWLEELVRCVPEKQKK